MSPAAAKVHRSWSAYVLMYRASHGGHLSYMIVPIHDHLCHYPDSYEQNIVLNNTMVCMFWLRIIRGYGGLVKLDVYHKVRGITSTTGHLLSTSRIQSKINKRRVENMSCTINLSC